MTPVAHAENQGPQTATVPDTDSSETLPQVDELYALGASALYGDAVKSFVSYMTEQSHHPGEATGRSWLTPNIKTLIVSAVLFAFITVVQAFAGLAAHSQALLMDCVSMGVDALTYMGNIAVELRKRDGTDHKGTQLIACAISLSCLLYFTYDGMQESWASVRVCQGWDSAAGGEDEVNGFITLGFGLGGVVFDALCLWAFYRSNKKNGEARHVNMFTALLHVLADCLRSTSTLVMSVLILLGHVDSTCADAYTSIIIGVTIIVGGLAGICSWLKLLRAFFVARFAKQSAESDESFAPNV